jgi:hypothetical protein
MNDFPSKYPGAEDDPLDAAVELLLRNHCYDAGLRPALVGGYGLGAAEEFPALTLPEAVDLMLKVEWKDSDLRGRLADEDFVTAANILRRKDIAPDEIKLAPPALVARIIRGIVERLLSSR